MDSVTTQKILSKAHPLWHGQFQQKTMTERVWQKLTPSMVIGLLENAVVTQRAEARRLLQLMQSNVWRLTAAPHEGGTGDHRGADKNLHVTLSVGGRSYHLGCKEKPALHIVRITA